MRKDGVETTETQTATLDPFRITDKLEDALLDVIVTRLEARGKHRFFQNVLQEYLDAMDVDSAHTVLDMGCGTGVTARTIARRARFSGNVTGIDLSPYLVTAARRLADEEGLSGQVEFRSGDTRSLDTPDDEFDAVVAHTLVSHVEEPFAMEDAEQGRRYDEALINALVTSPRVMR